MDNQKNCCVNCRITNVPLYLGMEHIALVEEIALETGRTKTQVLGEMIQFAYDHIELYEEGEA